MVEKQTPVKCHPLPTYDEDWINLIIEAKRSGLNLIEVRKFLQESKIMNLQSY